MHNEKKKTKAQINALIAQLPAEMQKRLSDPSPTLNTILNRFLYSSIDLRRNLTYLLIDHLKIAKVDWDDEEFEDFKILLETLEPQF